MTFTDKDTAISTAQGEAVKSNSIRYVINTHGEGHEVCESDFDHDRRYYHGAGGKKMFFSLVATVHPGGLINHHE